MATKKTTTKKTTTKKTTTKKTTTKKKTFVPDVRTPSQRICGALGVLYDPTTMEPNDLEDGSIPFGIGKKGTTRGWFFQIQIGPGYYAISANNPSETEFYTPDKYLSQYWDRIVALAFRLIEDGTIERKDIVRDR